MNITYSQLCSIRDIFNKYDPDGLIACNAPPDEYYTQVDRFLEDLSDCDVEKIKAGVLCQYPNMLEFFGYEKLREMSEKIAFILSECGNEEQKHLSIISLYKVSENDTMNEFFQRYCDDQQKYIISGQHRYYKIIMMADGLSFLQPNQIIVTIDNERLRWKLNEVICDENGRKYVVSGFEMIRYSPEALEKWGLKTINVLLEGETQFIGQYLCWRSHPFDANVTLEEHEFLCEACEDLEINGKTDKKCPRCGNEIIVEEDGNSYTIRCKTINCISSSFRGI